MRTLVRAPAHYAKSDAASLLGDSPLPAAGPQEPAPKAPAEAGLATTGIARQERLRILALAEQTAQMISGAFWDGKTTAAARAMALLEVAVAVAPTTRTGPVS